MGDGRLGGISTTISALDSLRVRGYDIAAVVLLDSGLGNDGALWRYLHGRYDAALIQPSDSKDSAEVQKLVINSDITVKV